MFNPVGLGTMEKKFIGLNLNSLKETASVVAYANDLHIQYFDTLYAYIKRDVTYNLSVIRL